MRKQLLDFVGFVVSTILLFVIWTLAQNGSRIGAAIGIAALVAWMLFFNNWHKRQFPQPATPENRKAIIKFLGVLCLGVWLVAIVIGAGIFGRSRILDYVFIACGAIGLVAAFIGIFLSLPGSRNNPS